MKTYSSRASSISGSKLWDLMADVLRFHTQVFKTQFPGLSLALILSFIWLMTSAQLDFYNWYLFSIYTSYPLSLSGRALLPSTKRLMVIILLIIYSEDLLHQEIFKKARLLPTHPIYVHPKLDDFTHLKIPQTGSSWVLHSILNETT